MKGCRALESGANQILRGLVRDDDSVSATVLELWAGGCVSLSSSRREAGTVFIPRNPRELKEAGHRCLCPRSFPNTEAVCVCPSGHKAGK